MKKNIYESQATGKVEKERLELQSFVADQASIHMLLEEEQIKSGDRVVATGGKPGSLIGETVLDVGGGVNSSLEDWAKERGVKSFTVFDVNPMFLAQRKKQGSERLVRGDVKVSLPFGDGSVDVVHERNVLPHIPPDKRERVVQEIIRVAKNRAVFLEYDWASFEADPGSAIAKFKQFMLDEMFPKMNVKPFLNNELKQLIASCTPAGSGIQREYRHHREEGNYHDEIFAMIKMLRPLISSYRNFNNFLPDAKSTPSGDGKEASALHEYL